MWLSSTRSSLFSGCDGLQLPSRTFIARGLHYSVRACPACSGCGRGRAKSAHISSCCSALGRAADISSSDLEFVDPRLLQLPRWWDELKDSYTCLNSPHKLSEKIMLCRPFTILPKSNFGYATGTLQPDSVPIDSRVPQGTVLGPSGYFALILKDMLKLDKSPTIVFCTMCTSFLEKINVKTTLNS